MSNFSDVTESPQWDKLTLVISGVTYKIPGQAKVSVSVSRKINKDKADKLDGEAVTDVGSNASSIKVAIQMSGSEYSDFCRIILPAMQVKGAKGKDKKPIICNHPQLGAVGIQLIILQSLDLPSPESGVTVVSMSFLESTKAKPTPQKKPQNFGENVTTDNWFFLPDENGNILNPLTTVGIPLLGPTNDSTFGNEKPISEDLMMYKKQQQENKGF